MDPVERRCLDRRAILQQLRETLRAVAALRAAHAAQHAHERAQQAEAGRRRDQQLSRIGALGRPPGPAGRLADVDRGIAAAEHELAGARAHIARLLADPALFGQPPGRLAAAHEDWRTRRAAYRHQPRTAPPRTAAAHPGVPRPESERRGPSLTRGGAVPGLGR